MEVTLSREGSKRNCPSSAGASEQLQLLEGSLDHAMRLKDEWHEEELKRLAGRMREQVEKIEELEKQNLSLALRPTGGAEEGGSNREGVLGREAALTAQIQRLASVNAVLQGRIAELEEEMRVVGAELEGSRIADSTLHALKKRTLSQIERMQLENVESRQQLQKDFQSSLIAQQSSFSAREAKLIREHEGAVLQLHGEIRDLLQAHDSSIAEALRGKEMALARLAEKEISHAKECQALRDDIAAQKRAAHLEREELRKELRCEVDAARWAVIEMHGKGEELERGRRGAILEEGQVINRLREEVRVTVFHRDKALADLQGVQAALQASVHAHTRLVENTQAVDAHVRKVLQTSREELIRKGRECDALRRMLGMPTETAVHVTLDVGNATSQADTTSLKSTDIPPSWRLSNGVSYCTS